MALEIPQRRLATAANLGGVLRCRADQTEDAGEALALAESFLLSRPLEHNLALTILHQRRARPEPGRYWAILDHGEVVGFALRSPLDFVATVTPMPGSAVAAWSKL